MPERSYNAAGAFKNALRTPPPPRPGYVDDLQKLLASKVLPPADSVAQNALAASGRVKKRSMLKDLKQTIWKGATFKKKAAGAVKAKIAKKNLAKATAIKVNVSNEVAQAEAKSSPKSSAASASAAAPLTPAECIDDEFKEMRAALEDAGVPFGSVAVG